MTYKNEDNLKRNKEDVKKWGEPSKLKTAEKQEQNLCIAA